MKRNLVVAWQVECPSWIIKKNEKLYQITILSHEIPIRSMNTIQNGAVRFSDRRKCWLSAIRSPAAIEKNWTSATEQLFPLCCGCLWMVIHKCASISGLRVGANWSWFGLCPDAAAMALAGWDTYKMIKLLPLSLKYALSDPVAGCRSSLCQTQCHESQLAPHRSRYGLGEYRI